MRKINKILVGVDLTANTEKIIRHAVEIAHKTKASLVLLHVYNRPLLAKVDKKRVEPDMLQILEKYKLARRLKYINSKFDELFESVPELKEFHVKIIKLEGIVVDRIIEVSETEKVQLIILGTRGAWGFEEFWGTKTAEICLNIKTPILVLPYNFTIEKPSRIAFAYDLKPVKKLENLDIIQVFSAIFGSEFHIFSIIDDEKISKSEKENVEILNKYFQDFSPKFHIKTHDDVMEGIFDFVKHQKISLLVILHRDRNFLEEFFGESITEKISFQINIPLLALDE
jgi:nucleotide-binding universal stress UspA family protein